MPARAQSPEELRQAFLLWSEGKEKIPAAKIREALTKLGDQMTDVEVDEFFSEADTDKDGTIDYEEFVRAMSWAQGDVRLDK